MVSFVYAASFDASGRGAGVLGFRWLPRGRRLEALGTVSRVVENPLSLVATSAGNCLYVADCTTDWRSGGAIYAHTVDRRTGQLTVTSVAESGGLIPVHLALAADERNLLAANCGPFAPDNEGRSVAVFPIKRGGAIGPAKTVKQQHGASADPVRQTSSHPHCIALDPDNRHVWVPDLGTDSLWCYRYDSRLGALLHDADKTVNVEPISGPRMLKFHPSGAWAYLLNEIAGTLVSFRYSAGTFAQIEVSATLPEGRSEHNAADLIVHPKGATLYTSSRDAHCVSTFRIDPTTGAASLQAHTDCGGEVPRGMALDATGRVLLVGNERSDTITGFQVREDGRLAPLGTLAELPGPACLSVVRV